MEPLTLAEREAMHGRPFRCQDRPGEPWYCYNCLADLPWYPHLQAAHRCGHPGPVVPARALAPLSASETGMWSTTPWGEPVRVRVVKLGPVIILVRHVSMGGTVIERRTYLEALLVAEIPGKPDAYMAARAQGPDFSEWRDVGQYEEGQPAPAGFRALADVPSTGPVPARYARLIGVEMDRIAKEEGD
jgi:hypothetical protein